MASNTKKIYFPGEKSPFDIIVEILGKNGLEESIDDGLDKIETGGSSMIEDLYVLTKDLLEARTTEKDFILSVQKQLKIDPTTTQNIINDIKEKLFPLAEMVNTSEPEPKEGTTRLTPPKSTGKKQIEMSASIDNVIDKKIKTADGREEPMPITKQPKGPDSYREPIE